MRPKIEYIGKEVTILMLKNYILDTRLSNNDTVLLNPVNFDNIVIEYRKAYRESIKLPFILVGVLIKEDVQDYVPYNRIGILKNDFESIRSAATNLIDDFFDIELAFRCGWCGNIVSEHGNIIRGAKRDRIIKYIETHEFPVVQKVDGSCCPNGNM